MRNLQDTELPFTPRITPGKIEALYDGKVYFEMSVMSASMGALLRQSRIVTHHPLRDAKFKGVYYVYSENGQHLIKRCDSERQVPSGCYLYHNWLLNKHAKQDKQRASQ